MQNGIRDITRHENNDEHRNAEKAGLQWLRGGRVDHKLVEMRNAVVEENRKVVECMIDCAIHLAEEVMAFQGKRHASGKFQHLLELLAVAAPENLT